MKFTKPSADFLNSGAICSSTGGSVILTQATGNPLDIVVDTSFRSCTMRDTADTAGAGSAIGLMTTFLSNLKSRVSGRRTYTVADLAQVINVNSMIAWVLKSCRVGRYRCDFYTTNSNFVPIKFGCDTASKFDDAITRLTPYIAEGLWLPDYNYWYFMKLLGHRMYGDSHFYVNCAYMRYRLTDGDFYTGADGDLTVDGILEGINAHYALFTPEITQLRSDLAKVFPESCIHVADIEGMYKSTLANDEFKTFMANQWTADIVRPDRNEDARLKITRRDAYHEALFNRSRFFSVPRGLDVDLRPLLSMRASGSNSSSSDVFTGAKIGVHGLFLRYNTALEGYSGDLRYGVVSPAGSTVRTASEPASMMAAAFGYKVVNDGFYPHVILIDPEGTQNVLYQTKSVPVNMVPQSLTDQWVSQNITNNAVYFDIFPYPHAALLSAASQAIVAPKG